ncbi:hypothetical protein LT493_06255 [Streptomyces tricolor]|nr:hypothetical protein [Streptomyces tricolor]
MAGRHVLVTGAGPIGCLVVAAAKAAGAARVTVTDLVPEALGYAAVAGGGTRSVRADDPDDPGWPAEVDTAVEALRSGRRAGHLCAAGAAFGRGRAARDAAGGTDAVRREPGGEPGDRGAGRVPVRRRVRHRPGPAAPPAGSSTG